MAKKKFQYRSDEATPVTRSDFMPWPEEGPEGTYMMTPMKKDTNGFLCGRAPATNVGVFPYILEDGTVQYELRPPEEVFEDESVKSLCNMPLTNNHPPELLTPENVKEYTVGSTGDVHQDQYHLAPSITVTDADAITDVESGKRGLSCGYTADVVMKSGNWLGVHYDAIQTNIRYNHLALVGKGRAGDAAKVTMGYMDSVGVPKIDKGASSMRKIKIDGLVFEVEDNLAELVEKKLDALEKANGQAVKLDAVNTDLSTANAKYDQLKEDHDVLVKEHEALKKADRTADIQEAVKARIDLEKTAEKLGVEIKADMSDADVKKAVILKRSPAAKEKLDAGDEVYLNARFDAVVEDASQVGGQEAFVDDSKGTEKKIDGKPGEEDSTKEDSDQAYERMVNRMKNGGKDEE